MIALKSDNVSQQTMNHISLNSFKESRAGFRNLFYNGPLDQKSPSAIDKDVKFRAAYRGISK